jgi:hypothetical protein
MKNKRRKTENKEGKKQNTAKEDTKGANGKERKARRIRNTRRRAATLYQWPRQFCFRPHKNSPDRRTLCLKHERINSPGPG